MQVPLTPLALLPLLQATVDSLIAAQLTSADHPAYGAVVNSDDGRPAPWATSGLITAGAYLCLVRGAEDPALLTRLIAAADALLALQRPGGLVDLPTVNIDSSPDTGFMVQQLCTVLSLGKDAAWGGPRWEALLDRVAAFVRRAVPGMAAGGFHTPNHRWVIAAALTQAHALFPDLDVAPAIDAYLAEGIDVDAEGFYIERSIGTYDAVNDRSWLLIAEHRPVRDELDGVDRNLTLDLHLLHADGTAETGLSHRQDYGQRAVPTGLIPSLLLYDRLRPTPRFVAAANALWRLAPAPGDLLWTLYALLRCGSSVRPGAVEGVSRAAAPAPAPGAPAAASHEAKDPLAGAPAESLPADFALHLPLNGIWRLRRGPLSVSVFRDTPRLLSFGFGRAMISAVRIDQTYFGGDCGRFIGNALTVDAGEVVLRSEGLGRPRRPGYELPLGRPVPPERWAETVAERGLRTLPPALSTLTLREIDGGLALHYHTLDGMPGVAAQVALDFEPGGIWETADTRMMPQPGQVLFLKQGWGEMRYGTDVIRIEGGAYAHSMWAMRETVPPGESVRVLLTFDTPIDHVIRLRGSCGPDAVVRG